MVRKNLYQLWWAVRPQEAPQEFVGEVEMSRQTFMTSVEKKEQVEVRMPSAFAPHFHLMRWPEEIYAGRLTLYDHRIRFDDLPQTSLASNRE